ncbi:hypothetical protein U0070_000679 [Myodes glareolus]|uniref:FCH domain-containing protein n=1 Tax=Myodes glareolus TaxID=447135 RepID=A0AAW0IH84_MYOGA
MGYCPSLRQEPAHGGWIYDQFDNLEKHTQWGIDILEKYIKFVKERTDIELSYAKQLRIALGLTHRVYLCLALAVLELVDILTVSFSSRLRKRLTEAH